MMTKRIKIFSGILFSLGALIFIFSFVDLRKVWENLQKLSWQIIGLVSVLYLFNVLLRGYRWRVIIKQKLGLPFYDVFKALVYGYMLNQLLPLKMGEIGRAEYLTRKSKIDRSFLLGSIAAERIFDMVIISLFLGISVLFSETIMSILKSNIISVMLILGGFTVAFLFLYNFTVLKRITQFLPVKAENFINQILDNVSHSFGMFNSVRKVTIVFVLTLLIWSLTCLTFYLLLNDLDISIPFYSYFFIVSVGTFGMIIPSTTANVGVYHAVAMTALMLFMVPKDQALSFAVVAHAFDFFPSVILGGVLFGCGRLNDLKNKQNVEENFAKNL